MLCPDLLKKALRKISIETTQTGFLSPEAFTQNDIDLLYKLGFSLYESGDYEKAKDIFQRLVISKPMKKEFWQALGASCQMTKNFEEALTAWSMVSLMDDLDPNAHFHAAECLLSLKNIEEASKALKAAKSRLAGSSDNSLAGKIEALESVWNKTTNGVPDGSDTV